MANQNYDKIILFSGLGIAVIACAWHFLSPTTLNAQDAQALLDNPAKNFEHKGIASAEALIQTIKNNHDVSRPSVGKQTFNIFVGPNLMHKTGEKVAIDIYESAPIHKDIPNEWFIKYGLEDELVMSNGADIDSDGDGFTNYEEYKMGTSPSKAESYPDLLKKLSVDNIKVSSFKLVFASEDPIEFRGELMNAQPGMKPLWKTPEGLKKGDKFGGKPHANRFELAEIKTVEGKNGPESVALIKDLLPEKQGATYDITYGKRFAKTISDRTATLNVSAGTKPGSFTIIEGKEFTIPGDLEKNTYFVEQILKKEGSVVIKKVGSNDSITIGTGK